MHPMLNVAVRAAREAGKIINRASLDIDLLRVAQKAANDFVTEVDRAAEQAIIDVLLKAYPQHGILGEETGSTFGHTGSDYQWIIDPLDGTTNFIHGMPVYAVSIALAHRGVVQQAVVYDPTRDELFTASRGAGAFLNSRRIRVSSRIRLEDSLIGTGFPFRQHDDFDTYLEMFKRVAQRCVGLRRPGAAAIDLAYVAAGRYDGFLKPASNPGTCLQAACSSPRPAVWSAISPETTTICAAVKFSLPRRGSTASSWPCCNRFPPAPAVHRSTTPPLPRRQRPSHRRASFSRALASRIPRPRSRPGGPTPNP